MKPFTALIHSQTGHAALVMGGGVSLPEQVKLAPAECVRISANQHGCFLMRCDYIVSCDDFSVKTLRCPDGKNVKLRDLGVPIVSVRRSIADYHLVRVPVNNSGIAAAVVGCALGCAPVLLAGMDCFQGGTYFHDLKADSTGTHLQLSHHLDFWRRFAAAFPGAPVRVLGAGPISKAGIFPRYDPSETLQPLSREMIEAQIHGTWVRVLKRWALGPKPFEEGEKIEVNAGELGLGVRKRFVELIR